MTSWRKPALLAVAAVVLLVVPSLLALRHDGGGGWLPHYGLVLGAAGALVTGGIAVRRWLDMSGPLPSSGGTSRPLERRMLPLTGLGVENEVEDYRVRYSEYAAVIDRIEAARTVGADVRFRYRTDDGRNHRRLVRPAFIHEHPPRAGRPAVLCLNAYHHKHGEFVDFSIGRLNELEIVRAAKDADGAPSGDQA